MLWLLLPTVEAAVPCLTPSLIEDFAGVVPQPMPARPPGAGKSEREALSGVANSLASDNFVLKWGSSLSVSTSDAQAILEAFETSYEVEVGDMEHPEPSGMDDYKFNVYVADSGLRWGSEELGSYGAAGYYYYDPDGWPLIALAPSTVDDPDYGRSTVAHEFYHAVQHATGSYSYDSDAGWFWESTACWMEAEVYPDDQNYPVFLFGFAFLPHYPVDFFDYYDTGAFTEYYQYGAFIFPRFLSEKVGDWQIIRDAWVDPGAFETDPLGRIDDLLKDDWGASLAEVFPSFAEANATWDYEDGDLYEEVLDVYGSYYPDYDESETAEIGSNGTDGWESVSADRLPYRYGTNYVWLERPSQEVAVVSFEGSQSSTSGSAATWAVSVGVVGSGGATFESMSLEDGDDGPAGEVTVTGLLSSQDVVIVVSAWSDERVSGEQFAYSYDVSLSGEASGGGDGGVATGDGGASGGGFTEPDKQGCCATAGRGGAGPGALLLLVGLVLQRRRRLS
jgi:uncharacterized protein (TIGR03382 family)